MRKELRYYQKEACRAVVEDWKKGEVPCISMMTALGKSLCAAALTEYCIKKNWRVICLVPTSELVSQNADEMYDFISTPKDIGIVCSQLNKMQNKRKIVIAMYQSFYSKRASSGHFDAIIIDEAHLISNNADSQYRKIIKSLQRINPSVKICGWTASPYRLGQGLLVNKCIKGEPLFTSIPYDTSVYPGIPRLVEEKSLAQIEVINTHFNIDLTNIKMSGHEFNNTDVGLKFDAICEDAVNDMREGFERYDVETALIFVPNCASGEKVLACWNDPTTMRMVSNNTTKHDRAANVKWLKEGKGKRYLVNVNIYTTGFNMPSLEAIVLMRATTSPGLLIQMLGRLIRPFGDLVGLVWDYGSNIERLGGIADIKVPKGKLKKSEVPKKLCLAALEENIEFEGIKYKKGQSCNCANLLSAKKCSKCGAQFIGENEEGKYQMLTKAQALQMKIELDTHVYDVEKVYYEQAYSRKDQTPMIKIRFYDEDVNHIHDSYLTLNHRGFARDNSIKMLISMLKNPSDYSDIAQFEGGVNVENVLMLLENDEYKDQYFKKIKAITLAPQAGGKFKELRNILYA
jgi:DNA repair protein RadD